MNQNKIKILRRHVDSYLSGKVIIKSGFTPLDISGGVNWDYQHEKNSNTYQTYLHSLNFINPLLEVAKIDNNSILFKEVRDIILDWYKKNKKNNNNYAWAEHPASYRIENIIEFQIADHNYKLRKNVFDKIIKEHCNFLNDERNYKMNNHGLMMDNALLKASEYIEDVDTRKVYEEKALYRVRLSLYRDFTRRGVHLENSPEYHRMVIILYRKIIATLQERNIDVDSNFKKLYNAANEFKEYIIKPNNEYPMLGDTGHIKEPNVLKKYGDFIDYDAGLAIFQQRDRENNLNSSHLTFNCGYQSKTHKHLDDLSLTYYVDGEDLLIDPGKYSYDKNDKIRKYLLSPAAHSTISIRDKEYNLSDPFQDYNNLRITKNYSTGKYKLISGINKLYHGTRITRTVIITKHPVLIIIDRVINNQKEKVTQVFNLNEKAVFNKISDEEYEIKINQNKYIFKNYKIRATDTHSSIENGYISYKFSKYKRNKRLVFEQYSKSTTFLTTINNNKQNLSDISFSNNILKFRCDEEYFSIEL